MANQEAITEEVSHQDLVKASSSSAWKGYEKVTFRVFFVYLLLLCIPTDPEWYTSILQYDLSNPHWNMLYNIAGGGRVPKLVTITSESGRWGLLSYSNLFLTFVISAAAGIVWTFLDKKNKEYNTLYYWIRVLARYQVGFAIVAWGFRKLVPLQMMWPPTNLLNTPIIYIQAQKLYWQGVGIAPNYEIFLGFAEVLAGFLLLFRRTTALGAALTVVILGNIAIANHVYDGSVHVHSFMFALVAFILLWYDLPRIWNLIVNEKDVTPVHVYPLFAGKAATTRLVLKSIGLFLFVVVEFFLHLFSPRLYRVPEAAGLKNAHGYYHVTEFRQNGTLIPYSPVDTTRWQDVVFEKWATIAIRINSPQKIDQSNGGALKATGGLVDDIDRGWEAAGVQGSHFFYSKTDTVNHILHLQNSNKAHRDQKQTLHYERPSSSRIILSGLNERKDSIYVILDRVEKEYPVEVTERQLTIQHP